MVWRFLVWEFLTRPHWVNVRSSGEFLGQSAAARSRRQGMSKFYPTYMTVELYNDMNMASLNKDNNVLEHCTLSIYRRHKHVKSYAT